MSVDINWDTLTGGPDGVTLAEQIRDFIHERFQAIPLPNLIRSVTVHHFDFGTIAPQITIKDITDPLPDFYDAGETDDDDDEGGEEADHGPRKNALDQPDETQWSADVPSPGTAKASERPVESAMFGLSLDSPLAHSARPGVLGATGYFGRTLPGSLSSTHNPLAAVAGAQFAHGGRQPGPRPTSHRRGDSFASISPPPTVTTPMTPLDPRPGSRAGTELDGTRAVPSSSLPPLTIPPTPSPEPNPEDVQIVFHVAYAGDVKLALTADVFLDFPMPSFVGIPLKLRLTGLAFDGVGVLAYIRKQRAHLCFLSPHDAEALVGQGEEAILEPLDDADVPAGEHLPDSPNGHQRPASSSHRPVGALFEDIHIESEVGESESGRQVLKNVGKIEKFILEQVQRIFEDEFVYPSFWTLLV